MKLVDYIKKYESKTGEKFEIKEGFELIFSPDHGFCQIRIGETSLFVWQMCGDARWWFAYLQDVAMQQQKPYITAFVRRKILPFLKVFGLRVIRSDNGRYYAIDDAGHEAVATLRGRDGGHEIYTIRCEVF